MNSNISMTLYNKLKGNFLALFTEKSSVSQSAAELQSQTVMWLRFPLVLLVLLIHVNPQNKEIFTPIQTIDVSHLTIANIYSIICRVGYYFSQVAVPFFFFVKTLLLALWFFIFGPFAIQLSFFLYFLGAKIINIFFPSKKGFFSNVETSLNSSINLFNTSSPDFT